MVVDAPARTGFRRCSSGFLVFVVAWLVLTAPAQAARRGTKDTDEDVGRVRRKVLLMPTQGPADEPSKRELNKRLREALQREEESTVVDAKATTDVLADSKAMGLGTCAGDDGECWVKLGVLADVALVLVPEARGRRSLQVDCGLWEVDTGKELSRVKLELSPSDTDMIELLVDRVFGRSVEAPKVGAAVGGVVDAKIPEPACVEGSLDCPSARTARIDDERDDNGSILPWLGLGAAGLGGVLLVGGAVGASIAEVQALDSPEKRAELAPIGGALWVTAVAGALVAGGGLALWWFTREVDAAPAEDQLAADR